MRKNIAVSYYGVVIVVCYNLSLSFLCIVDVDEATTISDNKLPVDGWPSLKWEK